MSTSPVTEHQDPVRVGVLTGSTRPGRRSPTVAAWIAAEPGVPGAVLETVDIADLDLPMLSEPAPAAFGRYEQATTRAWSRLADGFDGYVLISPEYNASVSPALKNALDHLYAEWADKAVGFVGYGMAGGHRSVEHLRGITAELGLAGVGRSLHLRAGQVEDGTFVPRAGDEEARHELVAAVARWAMALRAMRRAEQVAS